MNAEEEKKFDVFHEKNFSCIAYINSVYWLSKKFSSEDSKAQLKPLKPMLSWNGDSAKLFWIFFELGIGENV